MHKNITVEANTIYRLRAGQGLIRTGCDVEMDGKFISPDSYWFVYQPDGEGSLNFSPVQRRVDGSGWAKVPTYPLHVETLWQRLDIVRRVDVIDL